MRTATANSIRTSFVMATAIALSACGGGGGGTGGSTNFGNTLPAASGPGDAQLYFPNAAGDAWYFDTVQTPAGGVAVNSLESLVVTGQTNVMGVMADVFEGTVFGSSSSPVDSYYYKNAGGLAAVGTNDPTDTFTAAFVPYIEALFPLAPGAVASITKNGVSLNADLDGDGISDTANLTLKSQVVDFETLTIDLGSFPNAVKTTTSLNGNVILSSNHSSVPFTSLVTQWNAPGIGLLKQTLSVTVQNQTTQETRQARGYYVNGVGAGLTTPQQLLASLVDPSSDIYPPGPPALAGGGGNFLVVSQSATGMVANLFSPALTSLNNFAIGGSAGPAAAVFDGTNFVVAVNSNTLILHRVSPAGVDLDAPNGIDSSLAQTAGAIPAAAHGQSNTLLVYQRYDNASNNYFIFGVLVDANGQVLPPGEISIAADNIWHVFPNVSFDGTNFLVVWQVGDSGAAGPPSHIYGARVSQSGAVLDNPAIAVSTFSSGQYSPAVAFDGTNYLVIWQDGRDTAAGNPPSDIYGARVSPSGVLVDGTAASGGVAIDIGGSQVREFPQLVFSGSDYLVAWSDFGYAVGGATGVRLAQVTPSLTVTTPAGGLMASGAPPASSQSEFAFPILAVQSNAAAIVFLNNANGAKSILGMMDYSP
jgi:hypothetical protein